MIRRHITAELTDAAREYPVVTVFGPRQSGKTTLAQSAFPSLPYRSFEEPDVRRQAEIDPRSFLKELQEGAVLDEIQRTAHLLSYIQGIADRLRKHRLYVLTGSHQPDFSRPSVRLLQAGRQFSPFFPFRSGSSKAMGRSGIRLN